MGELKITYSRSSGPGGQNVNKLDTKVDLRFHVNSAEWISEPIRLKLANEVYNANYFYSRNHYYKMIIIHFSIKITSTKTAILL